MKNSKMKFAILSLMALTLVGCTNRTGELYEAGKYTNPDFSKLYYTGRDDFKNQISTQKSLTLTSNDYFNGYHAASLNPTKDSRYGASLSNTYTETHKGLVDKGYGDILEYKGKTLDPENDWTIGQIVNDDSLSVGTKFGRTKCLALTDSAFKDQGYLSKLYNGQMFCDGYHSKAFVSLDKNGYAAAFPKTLETGNYFLFSFRGGSNDNTYGTNGDSHARIVSFDLITDFYFADGSGFKKVSVTSKEVYAETDNGGEGCSFFGFKFADVGLGDMAGLKGLGVSYTNFSDPDFASKDDESVIADENKTFHWSLLAYEIMFPDSTWK